MRYLSPVLTAALAAGLFTGVTVDAHVTFALSLLLSAAWAALLLGHLRGHGVVQLTAGGLLIACAGGILGAHAVDRALNSPLRVLLEQRLGGFTFDAVERRTDEPMVIEGRLLADAAPTEDGAVLRVMVARVWINGVAEPAAGGVSLGVSGALQAEAIDTWRGGRLIRAPALLRRAARYLNEGVPDQERALARRGVSLVGTIKSAALVEVVSTGRWWEELASAVRARTRRALVRHIASRSEQAAAIATAILIGDRAGLTFETERRLQEAGTYHVIAISGGNIAILAGLLLGAMALAGLHGRIALVTVILALAVYGVIASGGASVLRATLMAVVYLAVRLIDQRTAPAHAIALTASVILLINPLQVVDVGFWFTFGATMALVTAATFRGERGGRGGPGPCDTRAPVRSSKRVHLFRSEGCPRATSTKGTNGRTVIDTYAHHASVALWVVLFGTACVELALAPIAAFVFERVTLAGLLLNFAALPAMTLVQLCGMVVVAADVAGLDALAGWLGVGVHAGAIVLVDSARLLDYAPWLTWRVPPPWPAVLCAYYASLLTALLTSRLVRLPRCAGVAGATAAVLFAWILAAPEARIRSLGDGRLHVTMLDVGQGDSVLVTFPNGRRLLVDTGGVPRGTFDVGDRVVGPALRARRLLSLDYLAVTHADADHAAGARSLVRDFAPREIWWGIPVAGHGATQVVRDEAERQRVPWRTLQRGDRVEVGGVIIRLLHPPPEDWERQRVRNNDSLVMELRFRGVSILLTGDIAHEVENELTPVLDLAPLVVLKVAHHGSLTSSSHRFLRAARPAVALIGVGRGNTYGHPAPLVMGRLHDVGAEVFRTDLDGQIDVTTDGESIWTNTFTGRRSEVS